MPIKLLKYSKVNMSVRFTSEGGLPSFRGVTLRGAIGHHLKRTVCSTRQRNCDGCILRSSCVYAYIFDAFLDGSQDFMKLYNTAPQPFVIETEFNLPQQVKEGEKFEFSLFLLGKAVDYFPYLAYSLLEIGKNGLGKERLPFEVLEITDNKAEKLFEQSRQNLTKPSLEEISLDTGAYNDKEDLKISFETPIRIRKDGKDVKSFSFVDLMLTLIRRLEILSYFYGDKDAVEGLKKLASECPRLEGDFSLKPVSIKRFSGRQQTKMRLNGVIGEAVVKDVPKVYSDILRIGELTHIGKNTSFGFGKITVDNTRS